MVEHEVALPDDPGAYEIVNFDNKKRHRTDLPNWRRHGDGGSGRRGGRLMAATVLCFALHALTGVAAWRQRGLRILKWTVLAGLAFFALLIAERLIRSIGV